MTSSAWAVHAAARIASRAFGGQLDLPAGGHDGVPDDGHVVTERADQGASKCLQPSDPIRRYRAVRQRPPAPKNPTLIGTCERSPDSG